MTTETCSIPNHEWLVLEMDDMLDAVDPVGIVDDRLRAHEYSPEIPDLIRLIVEDTLTAEGVKEVFDQFFGEGQAARESLDEIYFRMEEIRDDWRRINDSGHPD